MMQLSRHEMLSVFILAVSVTALVVAVVAFTKALHEDSLDSEHYKDGSIDAEHLNLADDFTFTGDARFDGGLALGPVQTITAATEAEATDATTIDLDSVVVAVTSAAADNRIYLPSPTAVPDGKLYLITVSSNGCELSSRGDGSTPTTINNVEATNADGTYAAELAMGANSSALVYKSGANAWTVQYTATTAPN